MTDPSSPRPAVPPGPIVSLVYQVAPERRDDLLGFLREACVFYEAPGGIRVALFEDLDQPGRFLELVAYADHDAYAQDQERMDHDPEALAVLGRWRALVEGPIEVRRLAPVPLATPAAGPASEPSLAIEEAAFNDHAAMTDLLGEAGLPLPSAEDQPVRMLVARQDGVVVGCVGCERYGARALLRSLAVRADHRRQGTGHTLVLALCSWLGAMGVRHVYLLTRDAAGFFATLGFGVVPRERVPAEVRRSRQFTLEACGTAACMERRLEP